jgi:hypothetical protein
MTSCWSAAVALDGRGGLHRELPKWLGTDGEGRREPERPTIGVNSLIESNPSVNKPRKRPGRAKNAVSKPSLFGHSAVLEDGPN